MKILFFLYILISLCFANQDFFVHQILHSPKNIPSNSKRLFSISVPYDNKDYVQIPSMEKVCAYFSRGGRPFDDSGKPKTGTYHSPRLKYHQYEKNHIPDGLYGPGFYDTVKSQLSNAYLMSNFFYDSHLISLNKNQENFFITENKNSIPTEYLSNTFLFAIIDKTQQTFGKKLFGHNWKNDYIKDALFHTMHKTQGQYLQIFDFYDNIFDFQGNINNYTNSYYSSDTGWIDFLKHVQCKIEN